MADTASFLGGPNTELGPVKIEVKPVEIDWADESGWLNIGKTQSSTFRRIMAKADHLTSQDGTEPSNRTVTGQRTEFEAPLGQPHLERLQLLVQDLKLVESGGEIKQWMFVNKVGEDDLSRLFFLRATKIVGGKLSTSELQKLYMLVAFQTETAELVYDAATQRFFGLIFRGYFNNDENSGFPVQHPDGEFSNAWSAVIP